MANPYYNHGSVPAQGAFGASPPMRGEFDLVAAGFALLPTFTGNASYIVAVNPSATALGSAKDFPVAISLGTESAPGLYGTTANTGLMLDPNIRLVIGGTRRLL